MNRRLDNDRTIRAPRGTDITAKSWQTEAPLRMLLNNLDREVAERPNPPRRDTCVEVIGALPMVEGARLNVVAGTLPAPLLLAKVWLPEGVE